MKFKRFIAAAMAVLTAVTVVGCKSKVELPNKEFLTPAEASLFVTKLGTYSGIEVDLTTQENAQAYQAALSACTPQKVTDRPVKNGDVVNIEYVGRYKDTGKKFEGGSASGAKLAIGSGQFIPGFEEGLIGVSPLEGVDLELTFPVDYHNPDFAGVEVVFSVFVNYIEAYSEEDIEAAQRSVAVAYVVNKALAETEFVETLPNAFVDAKVNLLVKEIEVYAESLKMSLEDYLAAYYQMTVEQMKAQALEYATSEAKTELMYLAIAHKEGITLSDEEYNTEVARLAAERKYTDIKKFEEDFGGVDDVRNAILLMKISDHIGSLNTIKK